MGPVGTGSSYMGYWKHWYELWEVPRDTWKQCEGHWALIASVGTGLSPCQCGCPAHRCPRSQPGPVLGVAPAQSPRLVARTQEDLGLASGPLHAVSPLSHPGDAAVASVPSLGTWGSLPNPWLGMWDLQNLPGVPIVPRYHHVSQVSPMHLTCPHVSQTSPMNLTCPQCTLPIPMFPRVSFAPPPPSSLNSPFIHHSPQNPQFPPSDAMSFSVSWITSSVSLIVCRA